MLLEVVGPLGIPDIALGGTAVPCPPPGLFIDLLMNFSSNDIKLSVDKSLAWGDLETIEPVVAKDVIEFFLEYKSDITSVKEVVMTE